MSRGRFPAAGNPGWSTSSMGPEELRELFDLIHEALSHVPYAICGLGALIDHGFTGRKASRISILCPQESKNNVKAWAAAKGYHTYADSVGVSTRSGTIRRVRIKYIDFGFESLQRTRSSFSTATVLSIVSQLDNVAAGYLDNRKRGNERALQIVAGDVFFCLKAIASRRIPVEPQFLPTFLGEDFFADFTARYPEAQPEMAKAGIDVSSVQAKHLTASTLRDHNEMLNKYGMVGDVVPPTPGQFEHMRDLKNSKSVYTIKERDSPESAEPLPRPPEQTHWRGGTDSNSKSDRSTRDANVPVRTPGRTDIGRSLTAPKTPKAVDRPVADWI